MKTNIKYLEEALKMTSIPHFDQMSVSQIISFFDSSDWEVTEKADGSNVTFGVDDLGVYVKSKKGNPVHDPQEYVDLSIKFNNDIHLGFGELLKMLLQNEEKFTTFYNEHNQLVDNKGFQIFGELFSKSHMNVIAYSPEKIGKGAVYVFMVKADTNDKKGIDITNTDVGQQIISNFIETFQGTDGWNFYGRRPVDTSLATSTYKSQIMDIINNNKDILTSRKRADKPLKTELVSKLSSLLSQYKKEVISQIEKVPSMLGADEIEGVVVRNLKNGELAKIVDLEGFGERRVQQWAGTDKIKQLRRELFNKIQNEILHNADIFLLPNKQIEKLSDALEERGVAYQNIEEMLNVLYQDAVAERPKLKTDFKRALNNLKNILSEHLTNVKNTINDVDSNNFKTYMNTKSSIQTETNEIADILANIENVKSDQGFYVEVIKFFIGFKGLNDLTNTFMKNQ